MSRENVEIVRQLYDELNRGDLAAAGSRIGLEVEWDTTVRGSDGGLVRGREAVFRVSTEWLDAWEDVRFDLRDVMDAGDQVVVRVRQHGRGKASGIEGDIEWFASFSVRGDEIVKYREYRTWPEALEAVGVRE